MVVDSRANKSVVVQSMILGHENKRQKLYVGVGVSTLVKILSEKQSKCQLIYKKTKLLLYLSLVYTHTYRIYLKVRSMHIVWIIPVYIIHMVT